MWWSLKFDGTLFKRTGASNLTESVSVLHSIFVLRRTFAYSHNEKDALDLLRWGPGQGSRQPPFKLVMI